MTVDDSPERLGGYVAIPNSSQENSSPMVRLAENPGSSRGPNHEPCTALAELQRAIGHNASGPALTFGQSLHRQLSEEPPHQSVY